MVIHFLGVKGFISCILIHHLPLFSILTLIEQRREVTPYTQALPSYPFTVVYLENYNAVKPVYSNETCDSRYPLPCGASTPSINRTAEMRAEHLQGELTRPLLCGF